MFELEVDAFVVAAESLRSVGPVSHTGSPCLISDSGLPCVPLKLPGDRLPLAHLTTYCDAAKNSQEEGFVGSSVLFIVIGSS